MLYFAHAENVWTPPLVSDAALRIEVGSGLDAAIRRVVVTVCYAAFSSHSKSSI